MASLKLCSLSRLARYIGETSYKSCLNTNYRSTVSSLNRRCYSSTEEQKQPEAKVQELAPEEVQKQIEALTAEVNTLKDTVKDYEDKYKRALADTENVRRRMTKQIEDTKSFAIQSFCKDLLDVADTLSMATESVPEQELSGASAGMKSLHDGVRLTHAQLSQVFARHGLQRVHPLHQKFDPNLHEALFQQEVQGQETGTVVTVSKVGYKLHERCVRPALVGVAK